MVLRWFVMHDTVVSVPSLKYTDCSALNKNYFLKCLPLCAKPFKPPFFSSSLVYKAKYDSEFSLTRFFSGARASAFEMPALYHFLPL